MSYMNLVYGPACHESFVAKWLEHPTSVWKVKVSIPVEDSEFSALSRVDQINSHFFTELKNYHH